MPTSSSRSLLPRRFAAAALAVTAAVAVTVISSPAAQADDSSTLTVLGTSDVSDSGLVQNVIKPMFEAANKGITLNYVGNASGVAIQSAEAGAGSALIVHAEPLENTFVQQGYSLEGPGRAIFYGDYVLLGPASDPAGVKAADSSDIVGAFEKIAQAGANKTATFVSRGGTPGTTISEHAIWPETTGVDTCNVQASDGGGSTPSTTNVGSDCPTKPNSDPTKPPTTNVTPPQWYSVTGAKQGANVLAADSCPTATFPNGGCYVFTDRGTYQYLAAQGMLKNLTVVSSNTADSSATTTGLLTNTFHAYAIDPAKFAGNSNVQINSTAAKAFLNFLTLPSTQAAIGQYQANAPLGASFLPDARPVISTSAFPTSVGAGKSFTVTGNVHNVVPGTPALANVPVSLRVDPAAPTANTYTGATATTDANGNFSLTFSPVGLASYSVATGAITQVERSDLSPTFSDTLQSTATDPSPRVTVASALSTKSVTGGKGYVSGSVGLTPADGYQVGSLQLYAARYAYPTPTLRYVSSIDIARGTSTKSFKYYLPAGRWYVQLHYVNSGVVTSSAGVVKSVTVG